MSNKCKIIYNNQGERIGVQEIGSNNSSQTFQDILNDSHTKNFDEALQIYKNLYSEDIKFSIIGEKGAQKLDELEEVTFRLDNLKVAKEMQEAGKSPSLIKLATGWEQNSVDKLWRYEVPDGNLKTNEFEIEKEYDLSEVIENNPIVNAYDSKLKIKFYERTDYQDDAGARFKPFEKLVEVYVSDKGKTTSNNRLIISDERGIFSTMLHEISHYVQYSEGFGVGGNTSTVFEVFREITKTDDTGLTPEELLKIVEEYLSKETEPNNIKILNATKDYLLTPSEDRYLKAFNIYRTISGEVEARSVQYRYEDVFNLNTLLSEFDDISPKDQIYIKNTLDNYKVSQADPTLKYQTEEGNVFNSYAEALRSTNGSEIKTGVNTTSGFQEIYSKSTNSSIDTQEGLINHLIKTGALSDKSYKENGKTHLIPEGRNFAKKRINAENIKDAFQKQLGIKSAKLKADSSIELNEEAQRNKVTVTTKNGEQLTVDISELNAPFSELKKKFDTYTVATALASDAVQKEMSKKTEVTPTQLVPENELQEKLLNLLNKFGIKMLSLETYQKQYNKRNELPISARALADIANKVVAFKDEIVENDDLVEETAHLIVASIPEAQKENLKRNIHKTKEWGEYAKQYEGVYATEEELREEILGKVVANTIKEKFAQRESNQTENAIIAKIKELFEAFLQNIRNFFQDSFQTELDKLNNDIFNNLFAETLDLNLESANGIFFNANEASLSANRLAEKTLKLIDIVKQQERSLTKKYKNPANNATIKSAERLLNFKAEPSISTGLKTQATQEIENEYPNESDSKKTELIQNRVVKLAEDLSKKQEESEKLNGVAQFIRLVSSQVNQLKDSANKKREDERPFDAQENPVYQTLIKRIRPALNSVKTMLDNKDNLQSEIISEIDKINNELGLIESKVKDSIEPTVLRITEELIDRYSMTDKEADEYREIVRSALRGEMKDTDTIHTYIGSLTMAKNPILNMAGGVQKRMTINANDDMQRSSKPFIDAVKNLTQSQWKKLVKEDEFFKGDSEQLELVSEIDSKKLNKELENIKKQVGKELLEKEKKAVNTQTDLSTNYNIFLNQDGSIKEDIYDEKGGIKEELKDDYDSFIKDFNGLYKEYVESEKETFFTEDYLKRLKKHSLTINGEKNPIMSEQSIQIYKDFQREITQIYMNAGGQNLSQSDLENKKEIEKRRTEASNPRDSSGEFIKGVTEIYDNNLGKYVVITDKNVKFDNYQERQKAFVLVGLNNYILKVRDFQSLESVFEAYSQLPIEQQIVTVEKDKDGDFTQNYLNEVRDYYTSLGFSRDIPQKFLNELNSFQTTEEKVSFLERNSYISFPDSYYEQFKQYPGLLDKLRTEGSEEALKLEKDIRKYQSIINRILRENRVHNRPAEINVMEMSQVQKNEVKFAQTQIDELMLKSRDILTDDVVDREIAVENKPNQAYFDYLKDSGVDELSYIMDNSTIKGRSAIEKAIAITKGAPITKGYSKWFNNNMDENEMNFALIQYARTKLLPYLKKSEPFYVDENGKRVTYTDEFNRLFDKKNPLRVEDWINEKRLVKISPDLSYFETSQRRNPNWKEDYHNYKPEFLAKIKDDRFEAIQKDTTLKTAYDAIIKYNDYQRENNNLTGIGNRFAVPGVRKTDIERLKSLKAGAITEIFKDFMEFREEEQEFLGSTKSEIYSPPTYYNRPLENKDEQTTNYMYAFLMYGKMATLHKHRRENLPDMYLLQDALHNTDTTSKNAIKMFDNYMDFNFFGKREEFSKKILGGRVDLGKVIKTMNNWSKMVNLSGFVVPLTNFSQNTIAKNMERFIGEIITPEASNKGNKLFLDLGKQTAKEVLGFDSKSVGNVMLESFGLYDLVHRFENSQFGKTTRGFLKTIQGNALHELANFPITERLMYGIISDYKYVDGKILHFTVFKKKMDAENFKGDLKQKWSEYKDFNMDFISAVKNGVLDVASDEMIEKVRKNGITGTDEEIKKYLETRRTDIALRVTSAITQLDAQVPQDERSIASRNPIASLFLNHLGFLMTGYQRRFKERNYEFGREGFTEGTYRTLANFASKIMLKPKDFRAIYNQLDTNQQKNLKRVLVELGYINALVFIGLLLMGMDDDDDNLYITELADLFSNRLAVETIGSSIGIGSTMYGVFDNPLMLKQKIKQWSEVGDLTEDEKRYKYLSNLLPFMRDIDKLSNPTDARQKYMHYQNDEKGTYKYYGWISHFMVDYEEENK